ncbi:DNA repair protein RadC [Luteibacter sp. 3190]|jgi:DNA repair protein RadC|uniref:RadC family protein n=1 Tax=Luteibacter sp. 3190 TaxID=2817736 RepID=UPI002864ABF8|nr:DNA repair protein RadC [Luteibacter sp. 3190]MDR6937300.1 DNA repair protein RadC [Luteibacter sp. 3190]
MKSPTNPPSTVRDATVPPVAYRQPPIRQWAANDRPRERLYAHGAAALSDAELLAVLIGNGTAGCDAVATGRALLSRAGSLGRLLAEPDHLPPVPGIGPVKRARLVAALELARRALGEGLTDLPRIESPRDSAQYLQARLSHLSHEVFACLFLDTRHRVLAYEELFRGTIDGASVYPREVVRACLRHHASAVILAHNHPSGVPEPSRADRDITQVLVDALALMDIRVLDHIVVGRGEPVSMAERGLLLARSR